MLHNSGPFGPNDAPVNVNPQSNMTSMSGRMNIGNNINNLPKLPQHSPQAVNAHFNLPDYPAYGLNMNPSLSPFQNFHHVGFQQNSMSQSAIHENWQNNMLPMNLNMQTDHPMLGFAQYGKTDLSEQSYNKSMLNVPQVHTKAFHKQMGMDLNYQYNFNPSYRPYMDYNLGLTSKHKTEDLRNFVDQNLEKERIASSPQYMEQIDLSNKHKMHSFTRPYLETATAKIQDSNNLNLSSDLSVQTSKRRDKPTYLESPDTMKSQMNLESRYTESQLDLSKPQKLENLNTNFQSINTDLRYYKDQGIRPHNLELSLTKSQKTDILNTNYSNVSSDLRIYKEQDSRPTSYQKMLTTSQLPENLNANFQGINSDYQYYKDKHLRSESLETSLTKNQKPESSSSIFPNEFNFQNLNSDLKLYKEKNFRADSLENTHSKTQKPENLITNFSNNTNFHNVSTDSRYYKEKNLRPEIDSYISKAHKSENLNTNFTNNTNNQNSTDLRLYKDNNLRDESALPKAHENLNVNFEHVTSDLRTYKDHDSKPHNLEKILPKPQDPDKLETVYENENSKHGKDNEPMSLETSLSKEQSVKNIDINFSNLNSNSQVNVQESKTQESQAESDELPLLKTKQPTESLIPNYHSYSSDLRFYKDQDSRRRSLENTVKMIENILSHSSNSRKSNFNTNLEKAAQEENIEENRKSDSIEKNENIESISNENKSCDVNTADSMSVDNMSNSFNKTDESDANTSNEMDMENINSNEEMDVDNQTSDESDMDNKNDHNSVEKDPQKFLSKSNDKIKKEVTEEAYSETSSDEDIKSEEVAEVIVDPGVKIDDSVVVKVEVIPSIADMEHYNPFNKDSFGVQKEDTTNQDIIDSETSINVAKELIRNGAKVEGVFFECPHCNLYFDQPKRFIIHTKWHSFGLTNEKRMELQKEKEMRKHMRKEARVVERMMQTEVTDSNAPGRKFNCRDCDKVFNAKASLKNHRQRYHPTRVRNCKICGKIVVGWMALRAHMATHTSDSGYQCDECPKRFKHPHSLAKHRDTHLEKTQACSQCPKKFGSVTLLNVHMKTHERALRGATFRCTYCGKGFFESYSLQVHERTHRNERPYLCEICNTSFGTNSSLKRHLKVSHSSTKPYECTTCHRSFISEAIRDRHTMRNHGNPEDFKFMCKQCPCKYLKLKDLRKHTYKVHPKGKRKKKVHSDSE